MLGLRAKKELNRIVYWQLILVVGLALVLFLFQGIRSGYSALLGSLAYWLPTLIFVKRVFSKMGASAAKRFVIAFFTGEIAKILLSAILFFFVVRYLPVAFFSTLTGFIGAVIAFWLASLLLLTKREEGHHGC